MIVSLVATVALAAELHVDPTGSDGAACTSLAPCATLERAVSLAVSGDSIVLSAGTWSDTASAYPLDITGLTLVGAGSADTFVATSGATLFTSAGSTSLVGLSATAATTALDLVDPSGTVSTDEVALVGGVGLTSTGSVDIALRRTTVDAGSGTAVSVDTGSATGTLALEESTLLGGVGVAGTFGGVAVDLTDTDITATTQTLRLEGLLSTSVSVVGGSLSGEQTITIEGDDLALVLTPDLVTDLETGTGVDVDIGGATADIEVSTTFLSTGGFSLSTTSTVSDVYVHELTHVGPVSGLAVGTFGVSQTGATTQDLRVERVTSEGNIIVTSDFTGTAASVALDGIVVDRSSPVAGAINLIWRGEGPGMATISDCVLGPTGAPLTVFLSGTTDLDITVTGCVFVSTGSATISTQDPRGPITIVGNDFSGEGFLINGSVSGADLDLRIEDNTFATSNLGAVDLVANSGGALSLTGNTWNGFQAVQVTGMGGDTMTLTLEDNISTADSMLRLATSADSVDVTVAGNDGTGDVFVSASGCTDGRFVVSDNTLGVATTGIDIQQDCAATDVQILGNTFSPAAASTPADTTGVSLLGVPGTLTVASNLFDGLGAGLVVGEGFDDVTVFANVVRDTVADGLELHLNGASVDLAYDTYTDNGGFDIVYEADSTFIARELWGTIDPLELQTERVSGASGLVLAPLSDTLAFALDTTTGEETGGTTLTITTTSSTPFVDDVGSSAAPLELTVTFGGVPGTVTFQDEDTLTVVTPPGSSGAVDVVVTNPGGQSGTISGGFTYTASACDTLCTAMPDLVDWANTAYGATLVHDGAA
ncbi:MAG: IPT/TIG domain-containing protein, partial [Myxococcales bacterium]|nr:IPT/TIG domain-containing protein [Myxococcales bacterium]